LRLRPDHVTATPRRLRSCLRHVCSLRSTAATTAARWRAGRAAQYVPPRHTVVRVTRDSTVVRDAIRSLPNHSRSAAACYGSDRTRRVPGLADMAERPPGCGGRRRLPRRDGDRGEEVALSAGLEVIAVGARTPIGLLAETSAAVVRAGIARTTECPFAA